jgi:rubrerythrin
MTIQEEIRQAMRRGAEPMFLLGLIALSHEQPIAMRAEILRASEDHYAQLQEMAEAGRVYDKKMEAAIR